ncbi:MAG: hypothetical protein EOR04_25885 [Mesorhizobium sp.]|uniref:DUF6471 domain-containing protein n=1 Tax=Mesorhizobium sp. TaxID=1871066 RepID=UPI000FE77804|nr:DUF6471 domain-containing protein [Mesorhizobium sp.]RWP38519.1 MAG: hypothetical protein EOR04_25885 [Mesorhizobium sp.]
MTEVDWDRRISNLLKAELKLRGITYRELADKLCAMGVRENEANIRNKLARGRFSAVFLAQCLKAIGSDRLKLD